MRSAEVSESMTGFPVERLKRAFAWLDTTKGMPKGVAVAKDVALWFAHAPENTPELSAWIGQMFDGS